MLQKPEAALGTVDHDGLPRRALEVLEANWRGASTVPSPALYPHQWSWDSACIAIGYSHLNQERAEQELRSLFAGQWRNGLLPHIVFADGQDYFPGPEFWRTSLSPDAPRNRHTSGIVQPPVHATSVHQVYRLGGDRPRAVAGADPDRHERRAHETAAAIERHLWSEDDAAYLDRDVRSGEWIDVRAGSSFAPLYAGSPSPERAAFLVGRLHDFSVPVEPAG